ncbi:MAG: SDR family oxidoreductase [Caldilineaceae bacterium]
MILVTGATGNIGGKLVQQLLETQQPVRVFVRDERKIAQLGNRVERAVGDFEKPETLVAAMQGIEHLFLNTEGFGTQQDQNAIRAAQQMGVKHVVKLSSLGAGEPTHAIAQWHHAKEEVLKASGLAWTMLRPGQFMSNLLQWGDSIKSQGKVYFPGGEGKVAPIDPEDIAAVAAVALTQPGHTGKAYQLTGPELLTVREQVAILARLLGKPLQYVDVPPDVAAAEMRKRGMPPVLVDALGELNRMIREGSAAQHTDTVAAVTGRPAHTFEEWCRAQLAAFQ